MWGRGPFGRAFWYPVHDQAIRVLESAKNVWRLNIKLPRGIAVVTQCLRGEMVVAGDVDFSFSFFGVEVKVGRW